MLPEAMVNNPFECMLVSFFKLVMNPIGKRYNYYTTFVKKIPNSRERICFL